MGRDVIDVRKPGLRKGRAALAMLATVAAMVGAQALSPVSAGAVPMNQCRINAEQQMEYYASRDIGLYNIWSEVYMAC
jgi:hypothetical protein